MNHDEQRIQQVLLTLQSNAIKFTLRGRITIKGEIKVNEGDSFLELSVIDTGVGIKNEDKEKLFKMFGYIQDSN